MIARESAFKYRGDEKSIPGIGEELGVQYILRGDIRWQRLAEGASRVRITPKLISVVENTNAWANIYDEKLEEIFAVQANVAEQVLQALNIRLLVPKRQALNEKPRNHLRWHFILILIYPRLSLRGRKATAKIDSAGKLLHNFKICIAC